MKETWTAWKKEVTNTLSITYHELAIKSVLCHLMSLPLNVLSLSLSFFPYPLPSFTISPPHYPSTTHANWPSVYREKEKERVGKGDRLTWTSSKSVTCTLPSVHHLNKREKAQFIWSTHVHLLPMKGALSFFRSTCLVFIPTSRRRKRETPWPLHHLFIYLTVVDSCPGHRRNHQWVYNLIFSFLSLSHPASGGWFHFPYLFIPSFIQFPFSILLPKKQAIFQASVISLPRALLFPVQVKPVRSHKSLSVHSVHSLCVPV